MSSPPYGCSQQSRGRELNTNLLFSIFSGYPGKIPGYPAKKFGFPGCPRTYRTFGPIPLHVEDPHPTRNYPDQKVWVWVPISWLTEGHENHLLRLLKS